MTHHAMKMYFITYRQTTSYSAIRNEVYHHTVQSVTPTISKLVSYMYIVSRIIAS
ncbi:hypothetical protein JYA63_09915 [Fictibacillus nanhaiensis]|uniref:Uncharacterized protein n=1 Tax=Fictibacillus nanhaiensis TaxID=742169 RepID=A0ABS2ZPK1_9BACL|nr:hypothetical protein [Fictibacillus nanhaiensis]